MRRAIGVDATETLEKVLAETRAVGRATEQLGNVVTRLQAEMERVRVDLERETRQLFDLAVLVEGFRGRGFRARWRWLLRGR